MDNNGNEKILSVTKEQCQEKLSIDISKYDLCASANDTSTILCETSNSSLISYSKNNEWYLIGLACKNHLSINKLMVHVNVAGYLEWIRDNMVQCKSCNKNFLPVQSRLQNIPPILG